MSATTETTTLPSIASVAREIRKEWKNVHYTARPYLDAMFSLNSIDDKFDQDDAKSIILYFLGNAASFRGPKAKELKAELKKIAGIK